MAAIDVYVAFVVGFCCTHLHNRSCAPASNLLVWVRSEPFQSTFLIQNGSECIIRLSGSCQLFVRKDRFSPVSQAGRADRRKLRAESCKGDKKKNSFCGLWWEQFLQEFWLSCGFVGRRLQMAKCRRQNTIEI